MKTVYSSIALTQETREALQEAGYMGERYEDTLLRLIAHYKNCPFAKMQRALRDILGQMDSLEYPFPKIGEGAEEYAKRVLSVLNENSGYQIKKSPRFEGEVDKDYLLRLILMEIGEYD